MERLLTIINNWKQKKSLTHFKNIAEHISVDHTLMTWENFLYHYDQPTNGHHIYFHTDNGIEPLTSFTKLFAYSHEDEYNMHSILFAEAKKNNIELIDIGYTDDPYKVAYKAAAMHYLTQNTEAIYPSTVVGHRNGLMESFDFIAERVGLPFVIKPNIGRKALHVSKIESKSEMLDYFESISEEIETFITQQYIEAPKDYRILVIGKKTFAVERASVNPDDFRHNSVGFESKPADLPPEMHQLAVKAAKLLGISLAGIDIIEDADGNYYFLEVNKGPGLKRIGEALDTDLYKAVGDFLSESTS